MKIVIACDSFKGCLSSNEAGLAIKRGILKTNPSAEVVLIPVSDGGEGMSQCFYENCGGEIIKKTVSNPVFYDVEAQYLMLPQKTAVIEMAAASGIMTLDKNELNPLKATTYGTGELICDAVKNGAKRLVVGLGGSATNDGGMGVLSSLGVDFLNADNKLLFPGGAYMGLVHKINLREDYNLYRDIEITLACDVENPYCGESGAAYVFAPQKGADNQMVKELDKGMQNLMRIFKDFNGADLQNVKGAGAAGGLAGGMYAMLNCTIQNGFSILCDAIHFEEKIKDADLMITGEGKTDSQTAFGKLPKQISDKAKENGIDCVLISGDIDDNTDIEKLGFNGAYKIKNDSMTLDYAIENAAVLLEKTAAEIVKGLDNK